MSKQILEEELNISVLNILTKIENNINDDSEIENLDKYIIKCCCDC